MGFCNDSWELFKKIKWENIKQICLNPSLIDDLKKEIESLKKELNYFKELTFIDGLYYRVQEEGEDDGPFCPTCYDGKKLPCHLFPEDKIGSRFDESGWICKIPGCGFDNLVKGPDKPPPTIPRYNRF